MTKFKRSTLPACYSGFWSPVVLTSSPRGSRTPGAHRLKGLLPAAALHRQRVATSRRAADTAITGWSTVCGKSMGAVRGGSFQKTALEKRPPAASPRAANIRAQRNSSLDLGNGRIDFTPWRLPRPNYLIKTQGDRHRGPAGRHRHQVTQHAVSAKNKPLADRVDALFADWRKDGDARRSWAEMVQRPLDWSKAN